MVSYTLSALQGEEGQGEVGVFRPALIRLGSIAV